MLSGERARELRQWLRERVTPEQAEAENARLKRLVAELALDKQMLQEVVQKKS